MANELSLDDSEIMVVACSLAVACSVGAAALLLAKKKRKHSTWIKKYLRDRIQYGECNTLLPELASNEVVKCVHYLRMDIEMFEELLTMITPLIQRKTTRLRYVMLLVNNR
jgi:hypothetical protein